MGRVSAPSAARAARATALAIACAGALPSFAATKVESLLKTTSYSVGEGLPSALVFQLAEDASGRIWILNREGIVSYDGTSFESQGFKQGLVATQCGGLTVDDKGRALAAATDGRIFRREGSAWRLVAPAIAQPFPGQVLSLAQSMKQGRERFAVTTTNGLWLWEDGSWQRLDKADDHLGRGLVSLARLGEDLFVGTRNGLCRLNGSLDCAWSQDSRLREPIIAVSASISEGRPGLLLLSHRWLGALVDGQLQVFGRPFDFDLSAGFDPRDPPRSSTAAIAIDSTGAIFFGTTYHSYLLEPGTTTPRDLGPEQGRLGESGMTSVLLDREGAIWIGTLRGLTRIGSRRFLSLDARSGLAENEVTAITELPGGRFLLGHNSGLTFFDQGGARIEAAFDIRELSAGFARGVPPRIFDFATDASGTIWAAAGTALLEIQPNRRVTLHRLPERIVSVEVDRRGRLFILCARGLYVRRAGRIEAIEIPFLKDTPPRGGRWLIVSNDGDRLYVTTSDGLYWWDGIASADLSLNPPWHRATSRNGLGDNVYAVGTSPSGEVLVGTSRGLYRLAGETLEELPEPRALNRPVYFLLYDRAERLWAGTDDGVFVSETMASGYRQLSVRHGLAGRETNRGAGIVDSMGRVWIGTDQGLSIYRESLDVRLTAPPTIEIRGLEIDGEHRPESDRVTLSSSSRSVVFHARTITFSSEEQAIARYRLEGLDEDWQGPTQLTTAGIRYTQLPPGRYRLRIAAAWRPGGPWGEEFRSAELVVPAPWWQRPWIWGIALLGLAVFLWTGHHLRLQRLGLRNEELESVNARLREAAAERQRLISELEAKNSELERFTYTVSHDLKAPLVTIRGFASLVEKEAGEGRLDRVAADIQRIHKAAETMGLLLNQLLDLSRIGRVVGTPVPLELGSLIRDATLRVPNLGSVQLVLAPNLPTVQGDRARLLEVFENLLGNAVKFMGAQPAPRIEVSLREGPEPVIVVSDNGVGIDPRFKDRVFDLFERLDKSVPGTGIGLAIVKRIVEFHGGRIWVESTGVRGEGSRFCLVLRET